MQHKNDLNSISQNVIFQVLKIKEIEFFEEYVKIMEPITTSFNIFQGEKNCFWDFYYQHNTLYIVSEKHFLLKTLINFKIFYFRMLHTYNVLVT